MEIDYKKELDRLIKENDEKSRQIGILTERNRIMDGLEKADLPLGVWPMIRDIICSPNP